MKPALAEKAIQFVLPSIQKLMESKEFLRKDLHIVVVDPLVLPANIDFTTWIERAILHEHSIGTQSAWERDFRLIARDKAYQSWMHQRPSQLLQTRFPYLVPEGHTTYFGSACRDGLVVAASGEQAYYDQMVSEWIHAAIQGLSIHATQKREVDTNGIPVA